MEANEADWAEYFLRIRSVCPWSFSAYKQQQIRIQPWHSQVLDLGTDQAIVYTALKHRPRQLKKITARLNRDYPLLEFLWSHPGCGANSTPVPVIIQQDQKRLESIRKRQQTSTDI